MTFFFPEIIPKLVIKDVLSGYHGLVKENETLVEVVPKIYAIGDVCNFNIVNKHHGEAPFEVSKIIFINIVTVKFRLIEFRKYTKERS